MKMLKGRPSDKRLALAASGIFLGLLAYRGYSYFSTTDPHSSGDRSQRLTPAAGPIPPEYGIPSYKADQSRQPGGCLDTASADYLRDFRGHAVEHCYSRSRDSMSCFHGTVNGYDRDFFCIAQGVVLDEESRQFSLECDSRLIEKQSPGGVLSYDETLRKSGPGAVLDKHFNMGLKPKGLPQSPLQAGEDREKQSSYTILVRREGSTSFWDSLMEIMSMTLSMDILRMSSDLRFGDSFITVPADLPRTQVIILDDLPEGPLYGLWSLFAGSPPVRFRDVLEGEAKTEALLSAHTAIVPLPGRSNPLSRIDQGGISDCRYSGLARTFARRVLHKYGVMSAQGGNSIPEVVRVTVIARADTRRIRDTEHLLQALRGAFPNVIARAVDLAALPMAEQLRIVQSTDVIVGAHGGGLSHMMFMREGEGAVVEIQAAGLPTTQDQARYKNLAAMLGRQYFLAEADVVPLDQGGSPSAGTEQGHGGDKPQAVEVELARRDTELAISEDVFVAQIGRAIEALVAQEQA